MADSVCRCRLDRFFAEQVRGAALIDVRPALSRIGLQLLVDTATAVGDNGALLPDQRIAPDFTRVEAPITLVVANPASVWARAGLRTGDAFVALNGLVIGTPTELIRAVRALQIGDSAAVEVRREGVSIRIRVEVTGYARPRVRIAAMPNAMQLQLQRRTRWLAGW